jgi:hypothetical protein
VEYGDFHFGLTSNWYYEFCFWHLNLVGENFFVWQIAVCSALFSVSAQMFIFSPLLYAYGKLK